MSQIRRLITNDHVTVATQTELLEEDGEIIGATTYIRPLRNLEMSTQISAEEFQITGCRSTSIRGHESIGFDLENPHSIAVFCNTLRKVADDLESVWAEHDRLPMSFTYTIID